MAVTSGTGGGWIARVRGPLALAGAFGLVLAAAFFLVYGEFGPPSRLALAAGILLLGSAIALDPEAALGVLRSRESRYGSNAVVISIAFVGILVALNLLGARVSQRWDLTAQRDFSLSDATLKVLHDLPKPVRATAFFSGALADQQKAQDLLKEYEARSGGNLTWELVDTNAAPSRPRIEGINVDGTIRFRWADQPGPSDPKQDSITTDESHLTTALIKLVNPVPLKVYFVTGHGERDLDKFDDDGYSELKTQIQQNNFTVDTINLLAVGSIPDDAAAVIIAAPKQPLQDAELSALDRYMTAKGRLVLLVDPFESASNADEIIKRWDLTIGKGVALDPVSSLQGDAVTLFARPGLHTIVKDVNGVMVLPFSTTVEIPQAIKRTVDVNALAMTADTRSWLETNRSAAAQFNEGEDKRGPLTLAVAVEEVDTAPAQDLQPGFEDPNKRVKNRAVIFGTSEFAINGLVKQPIANRDVFLNSLNWVTQTDQLIAQRPKIEERRTLFLTPAQSNFILFSGMLFVPALILGAGAVVWWMRR